MGLFCVSLHLRTSDDDALTMALKRRGVTQYKILPAKNGWTSLYEKRASNQDDTWIRNLSSELSKDLQIPAVSFLVHDSDIACYWLFDSGRLLDEFNSCPDYFGTDEADDESHSASGGRPEILVRYCRSSISEDEVAEILSMETVFAESVIERLAEALGIEVARALGDYRDASDDSEGSDESSDDVSSLRTRMADQFAAMFGADPSSGTSDPQVSVLVQAAAAGEINDIDRLIAEGVAIDGQAPGQLPSGQPMAGLGQVFPGGIPKIMMTPLMAAVANQQHQAAARLLDHGADPNQSHQFFGAPVHVATGAGDERLLQMLLDRGADVNARNAQGQTPLQVIAAGRATRERLAEAQAAMKMMGLKIPGLADQLTNIKLPLEGWDACEQLLRSRGAT